MSQRRCSNGHIYDPDIYQDHCPYCDRGTETIYFNGADAQPEAIDATVPPKIQSNRKPIPDDEEIIRKEEVAKPLKNVDGQIKPDELGATLAPREYRERQMEIGPTVAAFEKKHGYDPVVGWLVCVEGNNKGQDFPLRAKTNLIGRGSGMDVQIKGDDTISSNTHAKIDYDVLNNAFYLLPGNNRTTIYVNKKPVYSAQQLASYDRLRFGRTELLFVPFCNERFTWEEGEKE